MTDPRQELALAAIQDHYAHHGLACNSAIFGPLINRIVIGEARLGLQRAAALPA